MEAVYNTFADSTMPMTESSCPSKVSRSLPRVASQAFAVLSLEPVKSRRCSVSNAQAFTGLAWPSNVTTVFPELMSHARAMASSAQV